MHFNLHSPTEIVVIRPSIIILAIIGLALALAALTSMSPCLVTFETTMLPKPVIKVNWQPVDVAPGAKIQVKTTLPSGSIIADED